MDRPSPDAALAMLQFLVDAGADEAIAAAPVDRFAPQPATPPPASRAAPPATPIPSAPTPPRPPLPDDAAAVASARAEAAMADSLEALEAAVRRFEGCSLKRFAQNTVFADGDPTAGLMVIGEAPGADEDRLGRPFVGRSGQLLDRMLSAIGRDRTRVYITNVLYWRPPGNRPPTDAEIALCLPFVLRQIALVRPRALLLCGNRAAATLLGRTDGITRLRGRWLTLQIPELDMSIPTLPTFHPSFLLRSPAQKREAWHDLLSLQSKLQELT